MAIFVYSYRELKLSRLLHMSLWNKFMRATQHKKFFLARTREMNHKKTLPKKRFLLGSVVEIKTKKGLAYAQYVNAHKRPPNWGPVMCIIPVFYKTSQNDLEKVVAQEPSYYCFWPANYSVRDGIVKLVGKVEIPHKHSAFPVFKVGFFNLKTGRYGHWSLWHGNKSNKRHPVELLTSEEKKYPLLQLVDAMVVIERLEQGWTPESECD